jgi:hypothetical protein
MSLSADCEVKNVAVKNFADKNVAVKNVAARYDALQGAYLVGTSVICASVGDPDKGIPSIAEWLDREPGLEDRDVYKFVWEHNFPPLSSARDASHTSPK